MKVSLFVVFIISAISIEATDGGIFKNLVENKAISPSLTSVASPLNRCFSWCTRKSATKYVLPSCGYYYKRNRSSFNKCFYCRRRTFCLGRTKYISSAKKPGVQKPLKISKISSNLSL